LDQGFSEAQSRNLFDKLKNKSGLLEIGYLIQNITGTELDTVDFKNKMFKTMYDAIYQKGRQAQLLYLLEQNDENNDGKVKPNELEKILA
jgi:Ca2+-binding EF-hand superfamily protein